MHDELKRGKGILDDDPHLNMYLWSFGKMHMAKLETAYAYIPKMYDIDVEDIEIFDWGCGQGIATICLLDYLYKENCRKRINRITLIDPSSAALERAKNIIQCYNGFNEIEIRLISKEFDELTVDDVEGSYYSKLHLFSNILDVTSFDLAAFTHLMQQTISGQNYFVCVGPDYSNNRRVDEFIEAISPDNIFASFDKSKGAWKNDWSIALRIFCKNICEVEEVQHIRQRIIESQKHRQFFAGYILDEVEEALAKSKKQEQTEQLLQSLSAFDVHSNKPFDLPETIEPKLAVLNNIIVRGKPTIASLYLQNLFAEQLGASEKPEKDSPFLMFKAKDWLDGNALYEALHVIDPRFSTENYNWDILGSDFEKTFIEHRLKGTQAEYLIQLLEPQRKLSSIVSLPDRKFAHDQRVDFALELPAKTTTIALNGGKERHESISPVGFIVEIDGAPYHSNIFNRLHDERRNVMAAANQWDTYRLNEVSNFSFVENWTIEQEHIEYLKTVKKNYKKKIEGDWAINLQLALIPFAVARLEKILVEAIICGNLDLTVKEWKIAVVERDVPCAAIAMHEIKNAYKHLCKLESLDFSWPDIKLDVFSTTEFVRSPFHLKLEPSTTLKSNKRYDICIDVSMLLRDNIDAMPIGINSDTYYIIRSSHYQKEERLIYTSKSIEYPSFVEKTNKGEFREITVRKKYLTYFLKNIFRKRRFRQGQLPILSRALSNKTTIGLLPTGGGKSLTYQMSSMLQPGVTIVVDPLISLMVDQERGLRDIRIDTAVCVNSTMDAKAKNRNLNLLQNGNIQFMFLSPERFMMENFRDSIEVMSIRNNVYFAYGVIDEVHCVSEWGHDFRPAYLHLGRNMIKFMHAKSGKDVPVIGLTATASFDVLADVERELTLGGNLTLDSEAIIRPENDTREELTYKIVEVKADFSVLKDAHEPYLLNIADEWALKDLVAECKIKAIEWLFQKIPSDINIQNERHNENQRTNHFDDASFYCPDNNDKYPNAGIVFCPHAKGSFGVNDNEWGTHQGISTHLIANESGRLRIGTFVGGDKPSGDMKLFKENDQNLMVATKAFGMGIDKPNVRYTINLNHPSSLESFVQEAGRAGRDRKNAIAYLLFEPTKYIRITADKLKTIELDMGTANTPLWNLENKYVLADDFISLCTSNGYSDEEAQRVKVCCINHKYLENVDKEIVLWFHNNSFRGLYKEDVIRKEMTDKILNAKPKHVLEIQNKLRDYLGNEDLVIQVNETKNSLKVISSENSENSYGFIWLDSLLPRYKFISFDEYLICRPTMEALISILAELEDHSAKWLNMPINNDNTSNDDGIYSAMSNVSLDGYIYVTVSWENQVQQDFIEFEKTVKEVISQIAYNQQWNNLNEDRYGNLTLRKINSFDDLLKKISIISNDHNWLKNKAHKDIYKPLKKVFFRKRDKDDTDKAIYRMCCVGLVEDVTIDYNLETYKLKIRKRTDEEYLDCMFNFFRKYYSEEQSKLKVDDLIKHDGRNILDKCLGYLAKFVYENLEKKRYRSIDDIRMACANGIVNGEDWLKDFIHLYFNSKYARDDYQINGNDYSLKMDTDRNREDFGVVKKYIEAISIDPSGSEIDNVKHLYGATLLILRAHPDNAALNLLRTFCIIFLGIGSNQNLRHDAFKGYIDGFVLTAKSSSLSIKSLSKLMEEFNGILLRYTHKDNITEMKLMEWSELVRLNLHNNWIGSFTDKYDN